jgi:prepilin-type N-terminal cleavage/methylation domain-containing protein
MRRGFTIVEFIIVAAIIGSLVAVAIPSFTRYIEKHKAKKAAAKHVKVQAPKCIQQDACFLYVYHEEKGTWNRWDGKCTKLPLRAEKMPPVELPK